MRSFIVRNCGDGGFCRMRRLVIRQGRVLGSAGAQVCSDRGREPFSSATTLALGFSVISRSEMTHTIGTLASPTPEAHARGPAGSICQRRRFRSLLWPLDHRHPRRLSAHDEGTLCNTKLHDGSPGAVVTPLRQAGILASARFDTAQKIVLTRFPIHTPAAWRPSCRSDLKLRRFTEYQDTGIRSSRSNDLTNGNHLCPTQKG